MFSSNSDIEKMSYELRKCKKCKKVLFKTCAFIFFDINTLNIPAVRPVNEWSAITFACAHTCQYLFRHAIVAREKLYMMS